MQETAEWASRTFELRVPGAVSYGELQQLLADRLQAIISSDFQQFIYLLYRIDVSEKKVEAIIQEAAAVQTTPYLAIAALIIERQLQKIETRAAFRQQPPEDEEEKW